MSRKPPSSLSNGGRMTPLQVRNLWQAIHRPLSDKEKKGFLARAELYRIVEYPRFQVEEAIRSNRRLGDALKQLQAGSIRRSPSKVKKTASSQKRLREPTRSERAMWARLINRQIDGYLFEREREILGWYVDFVCEEAKLVVEVDGSSHRARRSADANRDEVMRANGYSVFRVSTYEVENNLESVIARIRHQLPASPSKKSNRKAKTAQQMPSATVKVKRAPGRQLGFNARWEGTVSSDSRRSQRETNPDRSVIVKGPVHCAGCVQTYVGTFRSDSGLAKCRGCGNVPIALCRGCNRQIFRDEETFFCKLCDPSVRAVALEVAGPGAQTPSNNLRSARRAKRLR